MMTKRLIILSWLFIFIIISNRGMAAPGSMDWEAKVDVSILKEPGSGPSEFIVLLETQADLSLAPTYTTKIEKGRYVVEQLTQTAELSQGPILKQLETRGIEFKAFWVANMIWVKGDLSLIKDLAERQDVAYIYANPWIKQELPTTTEAFTTQSTSAVEWNVSKIRAPDVWEKGSRGQGIVIGGQDTGYEWNHPALKTQYRGWDGSTADHNYHWHDAIHSGSSSCSPDSEEPCDDQGHGTHTMGTMVGDDGADNQVGVAPEAKWIGCRNMLSGVGSPASYTECYQWFIAPTDLDDTNPRPDLAPDIINNSWSCTESEGCTEPDVLRKVVENVRAAGILTVHSAGNKGPGCSTINQPAAIYDASLTIGATDSNDKIASFSSRGPVTVDGSNRLKPNLTAPGSNIRSATRNGGYSILSGTSMAAPHVAGTAALVLSAYPELKGCVDQLEDLLERTAVPLTTNETCGGTANLVPNNTYGWGRLDALSAYLNFPHKLEVLKTGSDKFISPGETITYALTITHTHYLDPTTNLVLTDQLPEGTNFLSSDTPYSLEENILTWKKPILDPGETWSIQFSVAVNDASPSSIANSNYQAVSDEVYSPASGPAVVTKLRQFRIFIPDVQH